MDIKKGVNCFQLTPFDLMTSKEQISINLMDDLKTLAYYRMCLSFIGFMSLVWMSYWGFM